MLLIWASRSRGREMERLLATHTHTHARTHTQDDVVTVQCTVLLHYDVATEGWDVAAVVSGCSVTWLRDLRPVRCRVRMQASTRPRCCCCSQGQSSRRMLDWSSWVTMVWWVWGQGGTGQPSWMDDLLCVCSVSPRLPPSPYLERGAVPPPPPAPGGGCCSQRRAG